MVDGGDSWNPNKTHPPLTHLPNPSNALIMKQLKLWDAKESQEILIDPHDIKSVIPYYSAHATGNISNTVIKTQKKEYMCSQLVGEVLQMIIHEAEDSEDFEFLENFSIISENYVPRPTHNPIPRHYAWFRTEYGIDPLCISRRLDFDLGSAFKCLIRASTPGRNTKDIIEDLEKTIFYIKDKLSSL